VKGKNRKSDAGWEYYVIEVNPNPHLDREAEVPIAGEVPRPGVPRAPPADLRLGAAPPAEDRVASVLSQGAARPVLSGTLHGLICAFLTRVNPRRHCRRYAPGSSCGRIRGRQGDDSIMGKRRLVSSFRWFAAVLVLLPLLTPLFCSSEPHGSSGAEALASSAASSQGGPSHGHGRSDDSGECRLAFLPPSLERAPRTAPPTALSLPPRATPPSPVHEVPQPIPILG
jgi:hypothetical protein